MVASATNQTVVEYHFPERYVLDSYHGLQYTCEVVATSDGGTTTTYTEAVEIHVVGRYLKTNSSMELYVYNPSPAPPNPLEVETEVSEDGPVEAGSEGLTLTCTVHETINGFSNIPSGHWMGPSGPVTSREGIVMVETRGTIQGIWSSLTINVTFSSLHTSHAGNYTCQWILFTPAEGGKTVTITSTPLTVTVRCKWCGRSLCNDGL